jgi:hypothetical protein
MHHRSASTTGGRLSVAEQALCPQLARRRTVHCVRAQLTAYDGSPMTTRPITRFDDATASNSNVDLMMAVVLAAAAAWVVYALGTPLVFQPTDPEFNPLIVLALILGGVAVYNLVRGVRRRRVLNRFGTTVFDQEGSNVYVGETLRGRVITSRPLSASDGFHLRVRCIEGKGETMDEKSRRTQAAILWETTRTVHTADSHAGIPVEFTIPTSALADAKFDSQNWTLKVNATVDGKPFEALFGLRVYAGSREEDEAYGEDEAAEPDEEAAAGAER